MSDERNDRNDVLDLLPDFVAGRLGDDDARVVREALAADEQIAAEASLLTAVLEARPAAPEGLADRIGAAVRRDRAATRPAVEDRRAAPPARRRFAVHGLSRWGLAAAAVAVVALGTLEMAERSVATGVAPGALEQVALEDAPDPWAGDDATLAGAPVLDGLSDEELSSLLEELGG